MTTPKEEGMHHPTKAAIIIRRMKKTPLRQQKSAMRRLFVGLVVFVLTTSSLSWFLTSVHAFSTMAPLESNRRNRHYSYDHHHYHHDGLWRLHSSMSGEPNQRGTAEPDDGDDDDAAATEARRMATVRYLQNAFYQTASSSNDNDEYTFVEPNAQNGGLLLNLPLWRVDWVELPGRTNVLNVFEPIYTNMFEQLLRSQPQQSCCYYFGHVHLAGGSKNIKHVPQCDWQSYDDNDDYNQAADPDASAVLGTLMRITDYQRLPNGRLLLLVQAMERFVVMKVRQNLPYGRADVQLLPDVDDWCSNDGDDGTTSRTRTDIILRNWQWKDYEFEETKFAAREVVGSVLAQVLPYAAMDTTRMPHDDVCDNNNDDGSIMWPPNMTTKTAANNATTVTTSAAGPSSLGNQQQQQLHHEELEQQLLAKGILKQRLDEPTTMMMNDDNNNDGSNENADELELQLWWALNDYLIWSKTPVSPVLLGLLPPNVEWPDDFLLSRVAAQLSTTVEYRHKYRPVSPFYPKRMRQRRLSYHAAYVCEQGNGRRRRQEERADQSQHQDRAALLSLSSTAMRMRAVLRQLEACNRSFQ
jgi:Lon protease-like protein